MTGFLAALLNRPAREVVSATVRPASLSYVCRRCDVFGVIGPLELRVCWVCELDDELEKR